MKKFWNVKARLLILFSLLTVTLGACELLTALGGVLGANALSLLGVQPASNFNQTGRMQVSMLPTDSSTNKVVLGSLQAMGVRTQLRGEDGKVKECEFIEERTEYASIYNSVALLIDDSGSMGREYPADVCETCPHDPKNLRGDAAVELAKIVFESAPKSQISVLDFGPEVDSNLTDTRVLASFSSDISEITTAISKVDGSIDAGTPLWDSLAETLNLLGDNAEEQEASLGKGNPTPDPDTSGSTSGDTSGSTSGDTSGSTSGDTSGSTSGDTSGSTVKTDTVKRYLIVLSDGEDTLSETETLTSVIALANQKQIPIYAVGLGPASALAGESGTSARAQAVIDLQKLAEGTGGFYASAQNAEQLRELYGRIGKAMSEGYKGADFVCEDAIEDSTGSSAIGSSNKVQGNVLLGNTISLPFTFVRPQ
jgi:hypothetical protein